VADWRDSLLDASIGGAPIFVKDVKGVHGRRTTVREMPGRDTPTREDHGRAARRWSVTAFVIGPDYMADRDAVIEVLESPGPYSFVHPWQGELSVVLDENSTLEVHESDAEGGWARLSFSLAESGEPDGVRTRVSTTAALATASAAVIAAVGAELPNAKLTVGAVFSAVAAAVSKVAAAMMLAKRKVMGALGVADAARLTDAMQSLQTNARRLLNTPDELLTTVSSLTAEVFSLIRDQDGEDLASYPGGERVIRADAALTAAQDLGRAETMTPPPYEGAYVDPDVRAGEALIGKVLLAVGVAHAADLFGTLPLESSKTADKVLEVMGGLFDLLLVDPTTSDDLFLAVTDLKAALDSHLAALAASLPTVETYTPTTSLPALLVAFWLYGDPTRDLEIVGRNRVPDPNFLPGGEPLEVLVDA